MGWTAATASEALDGIGSASRGQAGPGRVEESREEKRQGEKRGRRKEPWGRSPTWGGGPAGTSSSTSSPPFSVSLGSRGPFLSHVCALAPAKKHAWEMVASESQPGFCPGSYAEAPSLSCRAQHLSLIFPCPCPSQGRPPSPQPWVLTPAKEFLKEMAPGHLFCTSQPHWCSPAPAESPVAPAAFWQKRKEVGFPHGLRLGTNFSLGAFPVVCREVAPRTPTTPVILGKFPVSREEARSNVTMCVSPLRELAPPRSSQGGLGPCCGPCHGIGCML